MTSGENQISVIGGGLAGLISAILLARKGFRLVLYEKKKYPFHRVCGEYISNETLPFLTANGLFPGEFKPENISRLQLTSVNGKDAELPLDLGGFGISRYSYDYFLYKKAVEAGVNVIHEWVENIESLPGIVIGAFGKRSKLDYNMQRDFIQKRSPYVGVKYHVRIDHPHGLIALHNFKDGYCGISNVENGRTNLCYLTHRDNMRRHGNIRRMEEEVLFRNPFIKSIFEKAEFLFDKPEVINEITFEKKRLIENGVLMVGDAAGMITPLCGNGMAMAIHSAKIVSELIEQHLRGRIDRKEMCRGYVDAWHEQFAKRLWTGRQVQRLFGSEGASNFAVNLARHVKPVADFLIRQTHGT